MGCFYGLDRIASGFDCDTWQEWLSAMASANPQYGHEILDKAEEFISDLELAEKIQKNELDSIRQKNVGCGVYKEQSEKFFRKFFLR